MKPEIPPTQTETAAADEVLREVWRIKDELSASYGHDLNRLFADAREHQRKSGRPSVNLQTHRHAEKP
ncbi:MAG: hypothetical protein ABSB42_02035 [Tepidisphaeraceae bacterium]|jgi:hypothetical protein